jgi:hypothetical protein
MGGISRDAGARRRLGLRVALGLATAIVLCFAAAAAAHIERPAYWPDPRPDASVSPPAGGHVPKARSLASALDRSKPGDTRIVCHRGSLARAFRSIDHAHSKGIRVRPMAKPLRISAAKASKLRGLNIRFAKRCAFHSIQKAVFRSGNQDRIVVMPGVYTEPHSRKQPTQDPACHKYLTDTDFSGGGAVGLSYRYQYHCPNDQALINVLGRKPGKGAPPPPQMDRHGIPDLGPCIRCNLQIEGSVPDPAATVIDSGRRAAGNGGPSGVGSKKDVALKADRADGFVLKNVTVRHAAEHDVYVLETDGYLLDRVRLYYAGEYGALMFASDHGLTENCDAVGNGDSAVYPGGAPETDDDTAPNAPDARDTSFYPTRRLNQTIRRCDLHHNNLGYSGTMGNATRVVHNNFYGNTTAIATDSFFAGGHPGFPQSGAVFAKNRIFSNNFDDYVKGSDVKSSVGVPIGVGILIAGGNVDKVRGNRIWNNWRRGTMLLAVPDAISCPPGTQTCTASNASSTSYGNQFFDNTMGRSPRGKQKPNGVDFWWDEFPGDTGDCWFNNRGPDGTNSSWTGDPQRAPAPNMSLPGFLPENCGASTNTGTGDPAKEAVLLNCAQVATGDQSCEWYVRPEQPGSAAAKRQDRRLRAVGRGLALGRALSPPLCTVTGSTAACPLYADRP